MPNNDEGFRMPTTQPSASPRNLPVKSRVRRKRAHRLVLRHLTIDDYDDMKSIMDIVYANLGGAWSYEQMKSQLAHFPDGQICIEDRGRVVAVALSLIVQYSQWGDKHTYAEITADGYFTTHNPQGDTLYGAEVFVHPDYRDLRLGRRLYDARKEMCEKMNLRAIVAGGGGSSTNALNRVNRARPGGNMPAASNGVMRLT